MIVGKSIRAIVASALQEDIRTGDITTQALFPKPYTITARVIARQRGIVCGRALLVAVFKQLDRRVRIARALKDGTPITAGSIVCTITGDVRTILAAERVALNFLGRLSGIATETRCYVNAIKPYKTKILDTRKTTPGLRQLEKYAVRIGGGSNHRMGLYDHVLVKDNHCAAYGTMQGARRKKGSLGTIIEQCKKKTRKGVRTEVEVQNVTEFKDALKAKPDIIMLDNMQPADIRKAVRLRGRSRVRLEASGGVTLRNIRSVARTGIDMISIGALTHSVRALDFSLEIG